MACILRSAPRFTPGLGKTYAPFSRRLQTSCPRHLSYCMSFCTFPVDFESAFRGGPKTLNALFPCPYQTEGWPAPFPLPAHNYIDQLSKASLCCIITVLKPPRQELHSHRRTDLVLGVTNGSLSLGPRCWVCGRSISPGSKSEFHT